MFLISGMGIEVGLLFTRSDAKGIVNGKKGKQGEKTKVQTMDMLLCDCKTSLIGWEVS